jgi:hypothetical protein
MGMERAELVLYELEGDLEARFPLASIVAHACRPPFNQAKQFAHRQRGHGLAAGLLDAPDKHVGCPGRELGHVADGRAGFEQDKPDPLVEPDLNGSAAGQQAARPAL